MNTALAVFYFIIYPKIQFMFQNEALKLTRIQKGLNRKDKDQPGTNCRNTFNKIMYKSLF